jgi:membrane protein
MMEIRGLIGQSGAELVEGMLDGGFNQSGSILATIIGIVTLLLGATGLFGQLQEALNVIWDVPPRQNGGLLVMLKQRFVSFTMVLGIGFLLLVSMVLSAGLTAFGEYLSQHLPQTSAFLPTLNFIISFALITVLFAMMYRILPDVDVDWSDVWIGAAVTALLFTVGKTLLGLYLGRASVASAYGAAGSLVVILLWIYYSAQILFFGAEFTQVYAHHYGSKIVPDFTLPDQQATAAAQTAAAQPSQGWLQPQSAIWTGRIDETKATIPNFLLYIVMLFSLFILGRKADPPS